MRIDWKTERSLILLGSLLMLPAIAPVAAAMSREDARQLSDSLSTVYESEMDTLGFDPTTAELGDYLDFATRQSPELRAAFYRWRAAMERAGYVGALPDPVVAYGHFIESVETRVGPQVRRVALKQAFPWFGTLGARKDVAWESANAAYHRLQSEMLGLYYRVKSAYCEYYYLGREISITRENLQLLEFWESVARARYRVGLQQHPDVIKAQLELGKLEDQLHTLEDRVDPSASRLRAAMGLAADVKLPLPDTLRVREIPVARDSVLAWTVANNPDLKTLEHVIEKERAAKSVASKAALPSFQVGVDYIDVGAAVVPDLPESGKDAWVASVQLNVPIWFGANKARRQEAEAQLIRARYERRDAENRLRALAETVVFGYDDALRKTRLYRDGLLPKAEQSLNASYTAYQAGELDFLNVLDAQRLLLELQLQYERSRSDLAIRAAELEMITAVEWNRSATGETR